MNITVNQNAPHRVEVGGTGAVSVEVNSPTITVEASARTVQPAAAGFFVERVGEDWTIWFEDDE